MRKFAWVYGMWQRLRHSVKLQEHCLRARLAPLYAWGNHARGERGGPTAERLVMLVDSRHCSRAIMNRDGNQESGIPYLVIGQRQSEESSVR